MATSRICSIPDCGKPVYGRGWCSKHYERWDRHGHPLLGRDYGSARAFYLNVVLHYEQDECLMWPFSRDTGGYAQMRRKVHRMLCVEVNGPPPSPNHQAAHTCGKGSDGCVNKRHLSWKTPHENCEDKRRHGTHLSKLSETDVLQIRVIGKSMRYRDIADQFGVSPSCVCLIVTRQTWAWLE